MARKHTSSLKRKETLFLDNDTVKWLKQFGKKAEDFDGKGGAFERATKRIIHLIGQDFIVFMNSHNRTGETIQSLTPEPILKWGEVNYYKGVGTTTYGIKGFTGRASKLVKTKNILNVQYGFDISEGGLAAIFLDIGRPGIKYKNGTIGKAQAPSFFIYDCVNQNLNTFNKYFREEVMKELGGLL